MNNDIPNIWKRVYEITEEFSKRPLHTFFVNFNPILENINNQKYETPKDWLNDLQGLYGRALENQYKGFAPEKVSEIVNCLWEDLQKRAKCLDVDDEISWMIDVRDEVARCASVINKCPYPYLVNHKLHNFLNTNYDDDWPTMEDLSESIKLLEQILTNPQDDYEISDESEFYLGAVRDKIVDMTEYRYIKTLGKGGFGTVTLEQHIKTGKLCAVKYFNKSTATEIDLVRFYREIYLLATNQHCCILPFQGFSFTNSENDVSHIILTEYIPNGTLRTMLDLERARKAPKKWDGTRKTLCAYGIAVGMEFLHDRGVIHRDLKSLNVLLDEELFPKIGDFGLSKFCQDDEVKTMAIGTKRWMAPEMIFSLPYTQKVDVYSYGLVLFELLTKHLPYEDLTTVPDFVKAVRDGGRPQLPKGAPPDLCSLVRSCWATNPDDRPRFSEISRLFLEGRVAFDGTDHCQFLMGVTKMMHLPAPPIDFVSAVERRFVPIVRFRLKHDGGASLNRADAKGMFPAHIAVLQDFADVLELLLESDQIDVNARDSQGRTALHLAVKFERTRMIAMLLECPRLLVNAGDANKRTATHYAAESRSAMSLNALLMCDRVDVNSADSDGTTPLHVAVEKGNMQAVMMLVGRGDTDVNAVSKGASPLVLATRKNLNSIALAIVASGRLRFDIPAHQMLLVDAMKADNTQVVQSFLLAQNFDINAPLTVDGEPTTLLRVAYVSSPSMVALIMAQPKLQFQSDDVIGLVNNAIRNHNISFICSCLASGRVDFNYRSGKIPPPLLVATYSQNASIVGLLLKWPHIDVNIPMPGWPGNSPLHYAAQSGNADITRMLLSAPGVNKTIKNKAGVTPLQVAQEHKHAEVVALLS